MMSLGVSVRGIAGLIFLEGAALVVVGLAVGCLLGLALARLTLPLLTVTLSASLGGSTAAPLVFEWPELVGLMLAMAVLYLIGIALPAIAIGRLDVARRLRWRNA
jgi:ABC-type antimicrobial peptide transport system permease subunit